MKRILAGLTIGLLLGLTVSVGAQFSQEQFRAADGCGANPGYTFQDDPDSGLCLESAGVMALVINGSRVARITATEIQADLSIRPQSTIATGDSHLSLNTGGDGKQVRINSRNFTQATGSSIGLQVKPAQNATSTGSVIGAEISPRINNTFTVANVIGLHTDAYLKGTTARRISGDVRGLQVEMVTDDAATNTISGNVSAIRIRTAFSATTITGKFAALRIEKNEVQTNSKNYDAVMELTSKVAGVWNDDPNTELPGAIKGYIKVLVNGQVRYIALYDTAPTD